MPSLFDVARHFDDIQIANAYTAAVLFKGQFSSFMEASPDGSTAQRRTMSLSPELVIPSRRVITTIDGNWIVGYGNIDGFDGQAIRQSFWIKKATDTFYILTPGEAALASAGVLAYGHKDYLKDTVNGITDAEYDPFWDIYFSTTEPIVKGSFLRAGSTLYRVRTTRIGIEGLTAAASDQLDTGCEVSVTFNLTGAYSPVTDSYAAGSVATTGIYFDRHQYYNQWTEADLKTMSGDRNLVVASSAVTPTVGKTLTISGRVWTILAATLDIDGWMLHIRRA
jgi:hypothetical protein